MRRPGVRIPSAPPFPARSHRSSFRTARKAGTIAGLVRHGAGGPEDGAAGTPDCARRWGQPHRVRSVDRFLTRVAEKGARCGSFWQGLALSLLPVSWSRERQCTRWPISRAALIHWDKGPPPEPKRTAFEAQRVPEACGALVRSRPRGPPTGYEICSGSGLPGPPGASAGLAPPKRITP
jgi:hypothetical protein